MNNSLNQRLTKQKEIVYNEVSNRYDHPTAEQIFESVHKKHPHISKSTVYRNLDCLVRQGKINHVRTPGPDRYDSTLKNHYHIICKKCRKVIDVKVPYQDKLDGLISSQTGFKVDKHHLLFEGLCSDCLSKNKKQSSIK